MVTILGVVVAKPTLESPDFTWCEDEVSLNTALRLSRLDSDISPVRYNDPKPIMKTNPTDSMTIPVNLRVRDLLIALIIYDPLVPMIKISHNLIN